MKDPWESGIAYDRFMGRWSMRLGGEFLDWLEADPGLRWLDVGCGTGSLTQLIAGRFHPEEVIGVDASEEFIAQAQAANRNPSIHFRVGDAQALKLPLACVDVVVSGLMLNFVTQPQSALQEMIRVLRPGGKAGIFVWDYADGMQMLRYFWDAALALDPAAQDLDEGVRFPLCRPGQLESLARNSGLQHVEARAIECQTRFPDFDDYWQPFLGKVGPAPAYVKGLDLERRKNLKDRLHSSLPIAEDGSITLTARAWAVKSSA